MCTLDNTGNTVGVKKWSVITVLLLRGLEFCLPCFPYASWIQLLLISCVVSIFRDDFGSVKVMC